MVAAGREGRLGEEAEASLGGSIMRMSHRVTGAIMTVLLIVGPVAGSASAKRNSDQSSGSRGKGESSLALVVLDPAGGEPVQGGQVTFDVSTTVTDKPLVSLDCYQGDEWVYWASAGFYDEYPWQWARNFTLVSDHWTAGSAECTATLYYHDGRRYRDLTSIGFHANG